jgi:hypothetical protein
LKGLHSKLLSVTLRGTLRERGGDANMKADKKAPKKGYVTPRLIIHGSVEKITGGGAVGGTDVPSRTGQL